MINSGATIIKYSTVGIVNIELYLIIFFHKLCAPRILLFFENSLSLGIRVSPTDVYKIVIIGIRKLPIEYIANSALDNKKINNNLSAEEPILPIISL